MKLLEYIKGNRRGREAQRIEQEAMRDPLLGDAIEGFDKVSGDHDEALERLSRRIAERAGADGDGGGGRAVVRTDLADRRRRRIRNWSVAAGAVVLVAATTGTLFWVMNQDPFGEQTVAHETHRKGPADYETPISLPSAVMSEEETAHMETPEPDKEVKAKTVVRQQQPMPADFINIVPNEQIDETADVDFPDYSQDFAVDLPVMTEETVEDIPIYEAGQKAREERAAAAKLSDSAEDRSLTAKLAGRVAGVNTVDAENMPDSLRGKIRIRGTRNAQPANKVLGQVVDAATGQPLPGATVVKEGSKEGAVTGDRGIFVLPETTADDNLIANYLGYETQTVAADTSGMMLIAMAPSRLAMDEVVVVGYGTQKKSSRTGSVMGGIEKAAPAVDTTTTPIFRNYLAEERTRLAENGLTGSAVIEFEIDKNGRPRNIKVAESTSREAAQQARDIVRNGPDWVLRFGKKRITIVF